MSTIRGDQLAAALGAYDRWMNFRKLVDGRPVSGGASAGAGGGAGAGSGAAAGGHGPGAGGANVGEPGGAGADKGFID